MQLIEIQQNIGRRPFGNKQRKERFSERFRVDIVVLRGYQ